MNSIQQKIIDVLAATKLPGDGISAHIAAALIVEGLLPSIGGNSGTTFYRLKAEDWLSMLLASEPGMSLSTLIKRVHALCDVSEGIKSELGGISGRLHMLASNAA